MHFEQKDFEKRDYTICIRCETKLFSRHCKLVCPKCGAQLDCSDLE